MNIQEKLGQEIALLHEQLQNVINYVEKIQIEMSRSLGEAMPPYFYVPNGNINISIRKIHDLQKQ